jgi:hypothetical protein
MNVGTEAEDSEDTADWEDFVRAVVRARADGRMLQI